MTEGDTDTQKKAKDLAHGLEYVEMTGHAWREGVPKGDGCTWTRDVPGACGRAQLQEVGKGGVYSVHLR